MSRARRPFVVLMACAVPLVGACAGHRARRAELPPGQSLIVLLPDPETGHVGRAIVSNAAGSVELSSARDSTVAVTRRPPEAVAALPKSDVQQVFGEALAALPPPQQHYTLFFRFDSEELTDESRLTAAQIVEDVRAQRLPEVLVVGHTDRKGPKSSNFDLGLRRAKAVRTLLRDAGLEMSSIDVVSHGEAEPLVPTADGVFEPRNRRVEITVK